MPLCLVVIALAAASPTHAQRWRQMRSLPDSAFSGVIELRLKNPTGVRIGPAGLSMGTRTAIDLDALVGADRGLFSPGRLAFSRSIPDAEAMRARAAEHCRCDAPDLSGFMRLHTGTRSLADAWVLIERLNAIADVEVAYPVAIPQWSGATSSTPSFEADERHLNGAPTGIEARFSLSVPETRGKGVRIGDVEGGWILNHEDLPACADYSQYPGADMDQGTIFHGTAVLGEMFGVPNGFGVTGIAHEATCQVASVHHYENDQWTWNIAAAMARHGQQMSPGDVILLEVHGPGPNTKTPQDAQNQIGFVPGEFDEAVWNMTDTLTKQGIIVVAAAGNGGENLDAPVYNGWFSRSHHSGAIMVGAGAGSKSKTPRERLSFSNYGARVDLQAWGEQVTTLSYGDAQGGPVTQQYTFTFAGTSSASPIVAASVAVVNGYMKALKKPVLNARDMQTLLRSTGTAQAGNTSEQIGPLPNLRVALAAISVCGDGKRAPAEACDDGNEVDADGCSANCVSNETCGNSLTDATVGEVCDDGNKSAGDGCRADCKGTEKCGDGQVDTVNREICDDGNLVNGDGCTSDCMGKEKCGDGRIDEAAGEVCDDDNSEAGDGCSADCRSDETCGNGALDRAKGEECDDGNRLTDDGCDNQCKKPKAAPLNETVNAEATAPKSGCNTSGESVCMALAAIALVLRRARRNERPS